MINQRGAVLGHLVSAVVSCRSTHMIIDNLTHTHTHTGLSYTKEHSQRERQSSTFPCHACGGLWWEGGREGGGRGQMMEEGWMDEGQEEQVDGTNTTESVPSLSGLASAKVYSNMISHYITEAGTKQL